MELHAGDLVTDGVAVPLAAIDLSDKVFAMAFPALDGDYTLVAIDAQRNEIDVVPVTPPPPPPTGPPPPPPSR